MPLKFLNLDTNESIFFDRELEYIKAQSYDVKYPELKATSLIPVSTEAGAGAASITYEQYDEVGLAKLISNYADDLPRADVKGKEFTSPVRSLGDSYGYNIQEIRANALANKNLPTRKANAARRAIEQKINNIAFFARSSDNINGGLIGLIYNPNTTKGTVTTRNGHVPFATKTADEILADLNKGVADIISLTNGVESPDTLLLPLAQWAQIHTTPRSSTSDTTIAEYFLKNNPSVKKIEWCNELHNVNPIPSTGVASNTDILIFYKRDPEKLTLELPVPFEQLEVQPKGLEYVVPCHARIGGVIIYYPLSVNIVEGI